MAAAEVLRAIVALEPLIEKVAGYIAGDHDELPEVPLVLKSDIELERAKARAERHAAR